MRFVATEILPQIGHATSSVGLSPRKRHEKKQSTILLCDVWNHLADFYVLKYNAVYSVEKPTNYKALYPKTQCSS
jgi:hypothetical protein